MIVALNLLINDYLYNPDNETEIRTILTKFLDFQDWFLSGIDMCTLWAVLLAIPPSADGNATFPSVRVRLREGPKAISDPSLYLSRKIQSSLKGGEESQLFFLRLFTFTPFLLSPRLSLRPSDPSLRCQANSSTSLVPFLLCRSRFQRIVSA